MALPAYPEQEWLLRRNWLVPRQVRRKRVRGPGWSETPNLPPISALDARKGTPLAKPTTVIYAGNSGSRSGFTPPTKETMFALKSKLNPGQPYEDQKFALLVDPEIPCIDARIQNDADLYTFVSQYEMVVIAEFKPDNPFELQSVNTILTPEQFCADWMGD